jgi:hypothetical protein
MQIFATPDRSLRILIKTKSGVFLMKKSIFIVALIVVLALVLSACSYGGVNISVNAQTINGSGKVVTAEREVSDFTKVDLQSIGNLTIVQGDTESLTVKADDNLLPYITTEVNAGTLEIGMKPNTNANPTQTIEYTLTVKSLSSVLLSGFGNISADTLTGNDISVTVSGSGDINVGSVDATNLNMKLTGFGNIKMGGVKVDTTALELNGSGDLSIDQLTANDMNLTISGLGNASVTGKVTDEVIKLSGSGSFRGGDLQANTANVTISGLGNATTWVTDQLGLTITGSGTVQYYGDPRINQTITGLGTVKSLGSH